MYYPTPATVAGVRVLPPFVCVSVCFFPHDISKNDAARITKLDGNPFILGSKGKRSITSHEKTLLAWVFALLGVLATSSSLVRSTRIVYMNIFIYQEKSGSTKLKSEKRKSNRLN